MCDDDIYLSNSSLDMIAKEIWTELVYMPCESKHSNTEFPTIKKGRTRKEHVNGYCEWVIPPVITIRNPKLHEGYFSLKILIHELSHARGFTHGKIQDFAFTHLICNDEWSTEVIARLLRNGRIEVVG